MSLNDAITKLQEAREQIRLLILAGEIKSPEFEQAVEDSNNAIREIKEEVSK